MNIKVLRASAELSQKTFAERIGLKAQTIQKYESGERNIPDSIEKLIRYEFAEYLPENERLAATAGNGKTTAENEAISQLNEENKRLSQRLSTVGDQQAYIEVLKDNISLLKEQVKMYKDRLGIDDKSQTA